MPDFGSREEILAEACRVAAGEPGGTLATVHAEDATPYVTYVFFHLRESGEVIFGSTRSPQHVRNIVSTPEVSFLIDNREVVKTDWQQLDRLVIEGAAEEVRSDDPRYEPFLGELRAKSELAEGFARRGHLFLIEPRRLLLRKGVNPTRFIVDFEGHPIPG